MTQAERLDDIWNQAMDQLDELDDKMAPHLEGGPPGTHRPNAQQHRAWFEMQVSRHEKQYPPQWYVTPEGPKFGSLWTLTRPFVKGWDDEIKRYARETGGLGQEGAA